jgi:hypothetical protein
VDIRYWGLDLDLAGSLPGDGARQMNQKVFYLACPFTHPNRAVESMRSRLATAAAARLTAQGLAVISPLTHGSAVTAKAKSMGLDLGTNWDSWQAVDLAMLQAGDALILLKLPGWDLSQGVLVEQARARELGLEVYSLPSPASLTWEEELALFLKEVKA